LQSTAEDIFGKIEFVRSDRAKYIRARILPDGLRITLPHRSSEEDALQFILSEQKSISAKQEKLKMREHKSPTIIDENTSIHTLTFDVELRKAQRSNLFFSMKNGILSIEFPENMDCTTKENQKLCWNGINYFLRKEAKKLLPERTKQLALKFGFDYAGVKIQSSKSRWGSCSAEKNINLSLFLLLLPAHLIDYVILHELCHTIEMNHSDKFWKQMDKVTGNKSKTLRAELKKFNMPA